MPTSKQQPLKESLRARLVQCLLLLVAKLELDLTPNQEVSKTVIILITSLL